MPGTDWIFYDGDCGLCHRSVRFVLARDRSANPFRFAPLQGATFRRTVSDADRANLPDSMVLVTAGGELLTRSSATLYILRRLGGGWGVLSAIGGLVPAPLRDAAYDLVARVRLRLFAKPAGVCPLVPAHLRSRFEA